MFPRVRGLVQEESKQDGGGKDSSGIHSGLSVSWLHLGRLLDSSVALSGLQINTSGIRDNIGGCGGWGNSLGSSSLVFGGQNTGRWVAIIRAPGWLPGGPSGLGGVVTGGVENQFQSVEHWRPGIENGFWGLSEDHVLLDELHTIGVHTGTGWGGQKSVNILGDGLPRAPSVDFNGNSGGWWGWGLQSSRRWEASGDIDLSNTGNGGALSIDSGNGSTDGLVIVENWDNIGLHQVHLFPEPGATDLEIGNVSWQDLGELSELSFIVRVTGGASHLGSQLESGDETLLGKVVKICSGFSHSVSGVPSVSEKSLVGSVRLIPLLGGGVSINNGLEDSLGPSSSGNSISVMGNHMRHEGQNSGWDFGESPVSSRQVTHVGLHFGGKIPSGTAGVSVSWAVLIRFWSGNRSTGSVVERSGLWAGTSDTTVWGRWGRRWGLAHDQTHKQ